MNKGIGQFVDTIGGVLHRSILVHWRALLGKWIARYERKGYRVIAPAYLGFEVEAEEHDVQARMDLWRLARLHLLRSASTGTVVSRDARRAHSDGAPIVALAVQERSTVRHE